MGSVRGGNTCARNILQHGLSWMKEDRFRDSLDGRARDMWERLMQMERSATDEGMAIGYSQIG